MLKCTRHLDLTNFPRAGVAVSFMAAIVGTSGGNAVTVNMCWLTLGSTADELGIVGLRVVGLGGALCPFLNLECMKK